MIEDIIGYLAGFLIMISLIPQLIKTYKTKKTKDISLTMLIIVSLGTGLWAIYGFLLNSYPMIIMTGLGCIMNIILVFMKIKYK